MIHTCPHCGGRHDAVTGMTGAVLPEPGDVTLCIACGEFSMFDETLDLRIPTAIEAESMARSEVLHRARLAWLRVCGPGAQG